MWEWHWSRRPPTAAASGDRRPPLACVYTEPNLFSSGRLGNLDSCGPVMSCCSTIDRRPFRLSVSALDPRRGKACHGGYEVSPTLRRADATDFRVSQGLYHGP